MTKLEELVLEYKELKKEADKMEDFCMNMYERYRTFVRESDHIKNQTADAYQRMINYIEDKK
jgi:hypothetical protein